MEFYQIYRPLTASPHSCDDTYREYEPCEALKPLSSLFRYQHVWRDAVYSKNFCVQDAVFRYGYTDQAHLLKEFKKFHSVTTREAVKQAQETSHFYNM